MIHDSIENSVGAVHRDHFYPASSSELQTNTVSPRFDDRNQLVGFTHTLPAVVLMTTAFDGDGRSNHIERGSLMQATPIHIDLDEDVRNHREDQDEARREIQNILQQ